MAQAYKNAIDKLLLTQNIIRLTHVYKSVVSDLLMSFPLKVIPYPHRSNNSNYIYELPYYKSNYI